MAIGYSRSPILIKGAIIQFSAPLFVPIPNIIIFQYNPESLSRTLDIWKPPDDDSKAKDDPEREDLLSQPQNPEESFNVVLELGPLDGGEPVRTLAAFELLPATRRIRLITLFG